MKISTVILNSIDDPGLLLERIESQANDEKTEEWMQELLFSRPKLLPVDYFDESFAPLIPIGREVATASGYIDNLYVSPVGKLTIVETKLWKNPEKHRTVVAQIIDYAKEISEWDYDQLSDAILKASRESGADTEKKQSLDQLVEPFIDEAGLDITEFQDRVINNLHNGEFLLLIVGDRISPNVALLSDAIHGAPGLDFRMGLVELHLYSTQEGAKWPLLVVPDIVGRTVEVERGVVRVQYQKERPKIEVTISEEEKSNDAKGKTTPEIFLQKTPQDLRPVFEQWINKWQKRGFIVYWGVAGFSLRIWQDGKKKTVLEAYPEWAVSLIRETDAEALNISRDAHVQYKNNISSVSNALNIISQQKKFIMIDSLTSEDLFTILNAVNEVAEQATENKG